MTLTAYWPLLLLFVLLPLGWVSRHSSTKLAPSHLRWLTVVRLCAFALICLALTRPVWFRAGGEMSVTYLIDVSRSISPEFVQSAIQWAEDATQSGNPAQARYVAFGDRAVSFRSADELRSVTVFDGAQSPRPAAGTNALDQSRTNIETALRLAMTTFPSHHLKRLVLVTDGHETQGQMTSMLGELIDKGVRVFTMPAAVRAEGDRWVDGLRASPKVRAGQVTAFEVDVFARSAGPATVELVEDDRVLASREVALAPGLSTVSFSTSFATEGGRRVSARLRDAGGFVGNDVRQRAIFVEPSPKILYVEGRRDSAQYLSGALRGSGIQVSVLPPSALKTTTLDWDQYEALILSDIRYEDLSQSFMDELENYVQDDGGGFIFAAGESSYGEDGYSNSTVERLLPVNFEVEERWKDLSLIVTLDKSYSMYGRKIALAKEATKAALDLLEETHRFGVVTFDWNPYTTIPLQLAENKEWIKEGISRIQASAQTNIYPALERSYEQLDESPSKVKHVILLSDGKTYPDDYQELVARMFDDEITVSTVAVGEEADRELLANIAEWGHGRSYFIEDAERVQQIFIEETQIALEATLIEEPFRPKLRRAVEAFAGIDFDEAPELRGYVSTTAKDTAEILLEAQDDDPLLARWHYGLGTVVMFASDAKNRWASNWLSWEGYGKFWSQLVRESLRRHHGAQLDFAVQRIGDEARLSLDVVDSTGHFPDSYLPRVAVTDPDGRAHTVELRQLAPGEYGATLPLALSRDLPFRFALTPPGSSTSEPVEQELYHSFPDEYRFFPADTDRLEFISEQTGGRFQPDVGQIFGRYDDRARVPTQLWPWLAALGLLFYLFDLALRRLPWLWQRLDTGVRIDGNA